MIALVHGAELAVGSRAALLDGEAHHLRVRRAREGEVVELRDGAGLVGRGRLIGRGDAWDVEVERVERTPAPPALALAVGAGDRDRFAQIAEKAVELGVTRLVPVLTDRVSGVASRLRQPHLERLRRHALEAVKQSGNSWVSVLDDPLPLARLLAERTDGARWLADAGGAPPPSGLGGEPVTLLVGPEGGLTEPEREAALAAGYRAVSLGPHILRFETAALAAAAAVQAARLRGRDG